MKRLNKKGFTLVELLAVIVILAVVMLIAVTAVGPLMIRARKSALATEGLGIVKAAEMAYAAEQTSGVIKTGTDVCFELQWLCKHNYFEKGCDGASNGDKYAGSVLIDATGAKLTKAFWISNGTYVFGSGTSETSVANALKKGIDPTKYDADSATDSGTASTSCAMAVTSGKFSNNGVAAGTVYCSNANGCLAK